MTTMPQPASPGKTDTHKYDAWNRLVEVYDDDQEVVLQTNEYDGLGRQIVRVNVAATRLDLRFTLRGPGRPKSVNQ